MPRLSFVALVASAATSTGRDLTRRLRECLRAWSLERWLSAAVLASVSALLLWVLAGRGGGNTTSILPPNRGVASTVQVPDAPDRPELFHSGRLLSSGSRDATRDEPEPTALDAAALSALSRHVFPLDRPNPEESSKLKRSVMALQDMGASPPRRRAAWAEVLRWRLYLATPARPPLAVMRVSSFQGWRTHPVTEETDFHGGIDMAAPEGTPIYAPGAGTVVATGRGGGYGLYVMMDHPPTPYRSLLGHLSRVDVKEGEQVEPGSMIGAVGSTGLSTGPHLHFEVQLGEEQVVKLPALYESLLQLRDSITASASRPLPAKARGRSSVRVPGQVDRFPFPRQP